MMATKQFFGRHCSLDFVIRAYTFSLFKKSSQIDSMAFRNDVTLQTPATPAPRLPKDEARNTLLSALHRTKELQIFHEAAQSSDNHTYALKLKCCTNLTADIRDAVKSALERFDGLTSTRPQHKTDITNGKLKRVAGDVVRLLIMLENVHFNYCDYFGRRNGQIVPVDIEIRGKWKVREMVGVYLERVKNRLMEVGIA
jgi:hypothetical protein